MQFINYHKLILNLRGAGGLSGRQVSEKTGIELSKIHRMTNNGAYKATDLDMIKLLDLHYDYVPHLHDRSLML